MTIEFAPGYDGDMTERRVTLAALVDRRWIFCVVSFDTLRDSFGATGPEDAARVFEENRNDIETLMRSLIEEGDINADQETFLTAEMVARSRQEGSL